MIDTLICWLSTTSSLLLFTSNGGSIHDLYTDSFITLLRLSEDGWLSQQWLGWMIRGSNPGRWKIIFSCTKRLDRLWNPFSPPINMYWFSFLGAKRLEPEAEHFPLSIAEVTNSWGYTSTPLYAFIYGVLYVLSSRVLSWICGNAKYDQLICLHCPTNVTLMYTLLIKCNFLLQHISRSSILHLIR